MPLLVSHLHLLYACHHIKCKHTFRRPINRQWAFTACALYLLHLQIARSCHHTRVIMHQPGICQYDKNQQYLLTHTTVCSGVSAAVVAFDHTDRCQNHPCGVTAQVFDRKQSSCGSNVCASESVCLLLSERGEAAVGAATKVPCACGEVPSHPAHQVLWPAQSGPSQWLQGTDTSLALPTAAYKALLISSMCPSCLSYVTECSFALRYR